MIKTIFLRIRRGVVGVLPFYASLLRSVYALTVSALPTAPSPSPPPHTLGQLLSACQRCLRAGPIAQHLLSIYTENSSGVFSHVLPFLFAGAFLLKCSSSGFIIIQLPQS